MSPAERRRFDALLDDVMASLPPRYHDLLEEVPVIVEDHPDPALLAELGMDPADEDDVLCGLHTGSSLTDRTFLEGFDHPETVHLFREGIIDYAGGWEPWTDEESGKDFGGPEAILEQIRITLLHELGHHFGMEEDDLDELGYA